eukprot:3370167-Rhodomonas_salina.2
MGFPMRQLEASAAWCFLCLSSCWAAVNVCAPRATFKCRPPDASGRRNGAVAVWMGSRQAYLRALVHRALIVSRSVRVQGVMAAVYVKRGITAMSTSRLIWCLVYTVDLR